MVARSTQHAARSTQHAALALLLCSAETAQAALSYATCSTNVNAPTVVPYAGGSADFERGTDLPHLDQTGWYANLADRYTLTRFNPNVAVFSPRLKNVNLEENRDWLTVVSSVNSLSLTGTLPDGYAASGAVFPLFGRIGAGRSPRDLARVAA